MCFRFLRRYDGPLEVFIGDGTVKFLLKLDFLCEVYETALLKRLETSENEKNGYPSAVLLVLQ